MIKIYCNNCKETFKVTTIQCPKCKSTLVDVTSENFLDESIKKGHGRPNEDSRRSN